MVMTFETKNNTGSLFKNTNRSKDTQPHASGKALIDGKWYHISAWTKDGSRGAFQSISFKPVEEREKVSGQKAKSQGPNVKDHPRREPEDCDEDGIDDIPY